MILLDYSQVAVAAVMVELYAKDSDEPSEDLVRHMIFNTIRSLNMKFKQDFGEFVICIDGNNYWRKQEFPHYKAGRKKDQDKSKFDWKLIHECLGTIRNEVIEVMPYRCIRVESAEADDVIATIVSHNMSPKTLIVSGDEDYLQLQRFPNIYQWSPTQKKALKTNNPERTLLEHIIRGDSGDGIPNFLSVSNSFVDKIRQKSITEKNLGVWVNQTPDEICDTDEKRKRFLENQKLIDFRHIPMSVQMAIMEQFNKPIVASLETLYNHMIKKRMPVLMESIQDFKPAK